MSVGRGKGTSLPQADGQQTRGGGRGWSDGESPEPILDAFEIYVDDDRYSVPTLHLMPATDEATAVRKAHAEYEDKHHAGVELWRRGERMLALGSSSADNEDDEDEVDPAISSAG
jgi:hypothetical protein